MTFVQRTACKTHAKKRHNIEIKYITSSKIYLLITFFRIYPRNPECPQSEASLAQLSLEQRLEQQQIQQRLQQQQLPQQHHMPVHQQQQQQQHIVPVVTSVMDPAQQIQTVTLSSNQSIQVNCKIPTYVFPSLLSSPSPKIKTKRPGADTKITWVARPSSTTHQPITFNHEGVYLLHPNPNFRILS